MIDEPGCIAGRLISPNPARGPELSNRKSSQIFDSFTAQRLSTPDSCTNTPVSIVASTRSGAVISCFFVMRTSCSRTTSEYPRGALIPVPIAVAPMLISLINRCTSASRSTSSRMVWPNARNSWPNVIGTASWSCVRPILIKVANSLPFARNAFASAVSAARSSSIEWCSASLTAVG